MGLFGKKKATFDNVRFENNTKLLQQQLLDLTKTPQANDVVKVRAQNIISLLDMPVLSPELKQMEILDGQLFNALSILRDAIAQGLMQTTDEGLTALQDLIITNRNQGKLLQMVEEIKANVANLIEYTKIDLNNREINRIVTKLKNIQKVYQEKGPKISELEKNNLTREVKDLLNQKTNKESVITRLQGSIRGRKSQLDVLQARQDYQSMVANQLLSMADYKEAVTDVQLLKETIDQTQDEIDNVAEVFVDENVKKKDARALTTSLDELLEQVPQDQVQTTESAPVSNPVKKTETKDDLTKLLEGIED
jgi:hypothetical protein